MLEDIRVSDQPSGTIRASLGVCNDAKLGLDVSGKQHIKVRHGHENRSVESE
jgi:hypothetical protein